MGIDPNIDGGHSDDCRDEKQITPKRGKPGFSPWQVQRLHRIHTQARHKSKGSDPNHPHFVELPPDRGADGPTLDEGTVDGGQR